MKRAFVCAALAAAALAFADDDSGRHFADAPLSSLTVVYTATSKGEATALVEGPNGSEVLVRAGDVIAKESLRVESVGRGCLKLATAEGLPSRLCVDEAGGPRS